MTRGRKPCTRTRCPQCKRSTRPSHARLTDYPGTVRMVTKDGRCDRCWQMTKNCRGENPETPRPPIEHTIQWLAGYIRDRRRRGVPSGGLYFDGDPEPTMPARLPQRLEQEISA